MFVIKPENSMTNHQLAESCDPDEIGLREIFGILWQGKWIIVGISLVVVIVAIAVTLAMPNIYKSEVLLAPAEESAGGGLAALGDQLGGLASLAGVNLGKKETSRVIIGIEVLKSRAFITDFIIRRQILVPLMASKGWDAETGDIVIDEDVYDVATSRWLNFGSRAESAAPSVWNAYKVFVGSLNVSQAKDSGLVRVSVSHHSPLLARQWLEWLVEDVNSQLRQRDIEEATRSIDYLKRQLESTSLTGMQQVFYQLIEKQTQTIMLANVREQYVFKVIDPPVVPEEKASPKRGLIVLLSFVLATVFASVVVLVVGGSTSMTPDRI